MKRDRHECLVPVFVGVCSNYLRVVTKARTAGHSLVTHPSTYVGGVRAFILKTENHFMVCISYWSQDLLQSRCYFTTSH